MSLNQKLLHTASRRGVQDASACLNWLLRAQLLNVADDLALLHHLALHDTIVKISRLKADFKMMMLCLSTSRLVSS
jgi:hypothetical protein